MLTAPADHNAIIAVLDPQMSDGSTGALPADLGLSSDNPAIAVSIHNGGAREIRIVRGGPGPLFGTITATSGALSATLGVQFLGAPAGPTLVALFWNEAASRTGVV